MSIASFRAPIRRGYADTPWGQVHYRTCGAGRPLVLLHQTASSSAMYEALMPLLPGRVLALDTPGFGQSFAPEEPLTIPFCAKVLRAALQELGVTECDLFGHHTGAAIAVEMAHSAPGFVGRLILSGPPLLSPEQKAMLKAGLKPFVIDEAGAHLTAVWERLRRRDPALPLEIVHRETLLTLTAGARALETYEAVFAQDFAGQLAALEIPVLVMAGEHDSLRASLEPAYALLRHGQRRVIPGGTTYVCDRQPQAVAEIIREFLAMAEAYQGRGDGTWQLHDS
ncbi:MAG: alpha/beta hydrolase [Anaerolineales bacterium]|nr:alpha/beta hydrolase [Anaerolineales bacterium]